MKNKETILILILNLIVINIFYFNTLYSFLGNTAIYSIWVLPSLFTIVTLRKKILGKY
jgi:hypothetical protein